MKKFVFELDGKEIAMRLSSGDVIELEKKKNASIMEIISKVSFENVVTLIRYMRKSSDGSFSTSDAQDLIDELIDEGYDLVSIYSKIILPTCQVSGLISEKDLNAFQEAITDQHTQG